MVYRHIFKAKLDVVRNKRLGERCKKRYQREKDKIKITNFNNDRNHLDIR